MKTVLLLVADKQKAMALQSIIAPSGYVCSFVADLELLGRALEKKPDVAIVDAAAFPLDSEVWRWLAPRQGPRAAPVMAVVSDSRLPEWELNQDIDDFIAEPYSKQEMMSRLRRLLQKANKLSAGATIRAGALSIDDEGYEVRVGGRRVDLTYREYQLLRYLAANPGKVVTRETLLNKVWGYDYFGGDRTVDVHIRRLRSKLEEGGAVFIETVRNVGYRFKEQSSASIPEAVNSK